MRRERRSAPPSPPPDGFSMDEARRLYVEERMSLVRVGSLFGITEPSIRKLFEAAGVPIRPGHRCHGKNGRYKPGRAKSGEGNAKTSPA